MRGAQLGKVFARALAVEGATWRGHSRSSCSRIVDEKMMEQQAAEVLEEVWECAHAKNRESAFATVTLFGVMYTPTLKAGRNLIHDCVCKISKSTKEQSCKERARPIHHQSHDKLIYNIYCTTTR